MRKRNITKAERLNIIAIDSLLAHLDNHIVPHLDKMGKDFAKRIRTAYTNLKKGLTDYAMEIDKQDLERLVRESADTQLVLTSKAYRPKVDTDEHMEIVWTLAEHAIASNCHGCTKDGRTCPLKKALANADVPYATVEPDNCPYELPAKELN